VDELRGAAEEVSTLHQRSEDIEAVFENLELELRQVRAERAAACRIRITCRVACSCQPTAATPHPGTGVARTGCCTTSPKYPPFPFFFPNPSRVSFALVRT
jgi:hypothetical protein